MIELHSNPFSTVEPYTGWSQIPGILDMEKKLRKSSENSVQHRGNIVTNVFVLHSNICMNLLLRDYFRLQMNSLVHF